VKVFISRNLMLNLTLRLSTCQKWQSLIPLRY